MKMIATAKAKRYGGLRLREGVEFDVKGSRDAKVLRALGHAVDAAPAFTTTVTVTKYGRQDIKETAVAPMPLLPARKADDKPPPPAELAAAAQDIPKPKRTYTRRDLTAE